MPNIYEIPYSKLETILKRRRRVAKRNAASGLPVPTVEVVGNAFREIIVHDALARMRGAQSNKRTVRVSTVLIEVNGFTARYGDWDITGYRWGGLRRTPSGVSPYVVSSPEVSDSISTRKTLECDHCKAKRNRTSSYVVERVDGSGEPIEVGATCMAAFLGTPANDGVISGLSDNVLLLEEISRIAESNFLESQDDIFDEIDTVMAVAVSVISREGFVSARESSPLCPATWTTVYEEVRRYRAPDLDDGDIAVNLSDFMQAGLIVQWLRQTAHDADARDFFKKAGEILDTGISSAQDVAILTALVGSYSRHIKQQERLAREKDVARGSKHVGVIGARSNFVCSVQAIKPYQGRYGPAAVVEMIDSGGNLLIWFASGKQQLLEGRTYEIVGTVTEHEIADRGGYRGAEKTLLNRVKLVQDFGETPQPDEEQSHETTENKEFDELIGYLAPARM
jgi:hypothetical protein